MKRFSAFYIQKKRKVKQIVNDLNQAQIQRQKSILDSIIKQRKNKIKELSLLKSNQLNQSPFKPINKQYSEFMRVSPNSKDEPFLCQKIRRKVTMTDRVYSSQPNIKVGLDRSPRDYTINVSDKQLMNRKFLEYDQIINEQSPVKKIQKLSKNNLAKIMFPKRSNRMKKTYFQKFMPDKFNFYDLKSISYESIKLGCLSKQTDKVFQNNSVKINYSKLKKINSTEQTRPTMTLQLQNSITNYNKIEKSRILSSPHNQNISSKRKLFTRVKLQSIITPKNLDTLQY